MSVDLEAIAIDANPGKVVIKGTDVISSTTDPSEVFDQISNVLGKFYEQEGFTFYAEHKKSKDPQTKKLITEVVKFNDPEKKYEHKVYGMADIESIITIDSSGRQTQKIIENSDGFRGYIKVVYEGTKERDNKPRRSEGIDYKVHIKEWQEVKFNIYFNITDKSKHGTIEDARRAEASEFARFVNNHYGALR